MFYKTTIDHAKQLCTLSHCHPLYMSNKACWGRGRGQLFHKCWIITQKTPPKKKGDSFSFEKWELRKWHFVASLSFYNWTLVPRSTQFITSSSPQFSHLVGGREDFTHIDVAMFLLIRVFQLILWLLRLASVIDTL